MKRPPEGSSAARFELMGLFGCAPARFQALPQEAWPHVWHTYDSNDKSGDNKITYRVCVAPGHEEIEKLLEDQGYQRDPDVLDTWFSSMLWPQSTLGWPEATPELAYYYPTSVLVTSRDIITLWVARMVIAGLYNLNQVPFHHVYITVKLMDGFGETMSKSKGNGVDPLDSHGRTPGRRLLGGDGKGAVGRGGPHEWQQMPAIIGGIIQRIKATDQKCGDAKRVIFQQ